MDVYWQRRDDDTPPVTTAQFTGGQHLVFGLTVISTGTSVELAVTDGQDPAAADLQNTYYELTDLRASTSGVTQVYSSTFTLAEGPWRLRYWSADQAGNIEPAKELVLGVTPWLDAALTAPAGITLAGKASVTGQQVSGGAEAAPLYLPDLAARAAAANDNVALAPGYLNDGILRVSGNAALTITSGTYYLKGLELAGGARVGLAGAVELIVDGDVSLAGSASLNGGGVAADLHVYQTPGHTVKAGGAAVLNAWVYAAGGGFTAAGKAALGGHYFFDSAALAGNVKLSSAGNVRQGGAGAGVGAFRPASAAFALGEVYVFPNPAKGGAAPVFHVECGQADRVKISIYTISGRNVHEHILTGAPHLIDDGQGPEYAYEYAWRGHIPSGVYLYHVEAERGGAKLRKTGKFAVVR